MMINPVLITLGGLSIHAFTASILAAVAAGMLILLLRARQLDQPLLRWLDCGVAAVIGGVIGARIGHVSLQAAYFSLHPDQIASLSSGGFDWHGAVFGGLVGLLLLAWLRRVPLAALTDTLALIFPLGAALIGAGSGAAAAVYGVEVSTLADYPAWLVSETPDIYGSVAPRIDVPHLGIALALLLGIVVIALSLSRHTRGLRLWVVLGSFGLLMALLSFFRADMVASWFGHRADQVLDLAVLLLATLLGAITWLNRRAANHATTPADPGRSFRLGHAIRKSPAPEEDRPA